MNTTVTQWPTDVAVHPAAELFPLMTQAELGDLADDIKANGLTHPIVTTPDGRILDGRNRLLACQRIGVQPHHSTYDGEPWPYVISTNLHRRHLTDGQRALIAAKIAERRVGRPKKMSSDDGISEVPPSRKEVTRLLNVSRAQVDRARAVANHGVPELTEAVSQGQVPVTTASRVATLAPAEQRSFVDRVTNGENPWKVAPPERATGRPNGLNHHPVVEPSPLRQRRQFTTSTVVGRQAVASIVATLDGYGDRLDTATCVDPTTTAEEAAQWINGLSKGIRSLSRLRRLLKECTSQ